MLDKVKCFLDFHKWNEPQWKTDSNNDCVQIRICIRCNTKNEKVIGAHQYSPWQPRVDQMCFEIEVCKRCNHNETRLNHEWSQWQYIAESSCEQERSCSRCNTKESHINHQWEPFELPSYGSKDVLCLRCNEKGYVKARLYIPNPFEQDRVSDEDIGNSDWYKR